MSVPTPAVRATDRSGVSATGSAAGISVRSLRHEYVDEQSGHRVLAIERLDLDIADGEFVCILGPSGCGKSTLLYLIAGLLQPSEGEIRVDGRLVRGPGRDRGIVFQEYALLPWKTVLANVSLGPKLRGVGRAERDRIANAYLDLVGLHDFGSSYPHQLSGGMRQRVAVARTLAADPRVVLMDEPFAAVDAQTRLTLQEETSRIWRETRKTIVFVTHAVDEAAFLGDRVVVLAPRPGRVKEIVDVEVSRDARTRTNPDYDHLVNRLLGLVRNIDS